MRLAIASTLTLVACGAGLTDADKNNLKNAAELTSMAYRYQDAGPAQALDRGAHCAVRAVLRNNMIDTPDSGIVCPGAP